MQLLTKTPLNRCPVRYVKKWPTYQETGFSLYYVFKMKKSQNVKDFVKIEGRERGKVECVFPMVVVSILPHAEFGPNDHWEDTSHFIFPAGSNFKILLLIQ